MKGEGGRTSINTIVAGSRVEEDLSFFASARDHTTKRGGKEGGESR